MGHPTINEKPYWQRRSIMSTNGKRTSNKKSTTTRKQGNVVPQQDKEPNSIFIGNKPTMNYVMGAMMILNRGELCTIKARGKAISHAFDVAEILLHRYVPEAKYTSIQPSTVEILNAENGTKSRVTSIEIGLKK